MPAAPVEIRTLLVANRGEIARRIFRTARAMGIRTVAVVSEADAGEPFEREADLAVRIGGAAPGESYLRSELIIDAARRTGADAIHPGYGFLAENARFARACAEAGIAFVGPSPAAIDAMGSKLGAKRLLAGAGVPVLPDVDATGLHDDALLEAAAGVGYPLLVKPSAGGGGKGMRVVSSPDELAAAVDGSRREALGAFGDDTLLLERYVESGRHVEIQIMGDLHGRVASLGERECSVQRRHQKILEESPSVAVDDALRERMGAAAVAAGTALGYAGAGTVEFLLAADGSGEFFFLEVNTRLQVEHPVTELVTGLDLVRLQLQVAAGMPLPEELGAVRPSGHAIEVRLYAEDPASDFLPQTGRVSHLRFPDGVDGLRVDGGVESGSAISIHYDPMIAKVLAHAPTRSEAARVLAGALRATELDGVATNRDFLVRLLEDPAFLRGDVDTRFLERPAAAALLDPLVGEEERARALVAAAVAGAASRRSAARVQASLPSGWRSNPSGLQTVEYELRGRVEPLVVGYRFARDGVTLAAAEVDSRVIDLALDGPVVVAVGSHGDADDRVRTVELALVDGGVRRAYRVRTEGDSVHVSGPDGQLDLRELPRFPDPSDQRAPGSLLAPMPGSVVRTFAAVGDTVAAGAPLLVLEAMKMEHEITAPAAGVVAELPVAVGAQVEAGTLLARVDET